MAGIQSVFDLAISIPHQLVDIQGGMLTGTDEHAALELVIAEFGNLSDNSTCLPKLNYVLFPFLPIHI